MVQRFVSIILCGDQELQHLVFVENFKLLLNQLGLSGAICSIQSDYPPHYRIIQTAM